MHRLLALVAFVVIAGPLPAQMSESIAKAAETITTEDVARHIRVIADDSMMGRDTPSRGLELTAQYVADHFKRFGLKPGGDNGTWFQRYTIKDDTVALPNTVGILEGSDPKLKHEYIVFSAHMDHVGISSGEKPDSIYNGADDNASGTAGILELAEALSQPGARPRRSLIFLAVSGEEKGILGSRHFVEHPPVPIDQLVANLNFDMISRKWVDTIWVVGKAQSDLGATLDRISAAHPELRMAAVPDPRGDLLNSDHASFASKGVPFLKFGNGPHEDYHQATDSPEKSNAEKEARILHLVFYLSQEIANADQRPK